MCFMERAISTTAAVEEWRPVVGWEGLYDVSNIGRVRSLVRYYDIINKRGIPMHIKRGGKVIKGKIMPNGYILIRLRKDGEETNALAHRLVAQAFIPNPDNLPIINHKDLNTCNNRVDNLEWCDYHYNNTYADAGKRRAECRRIAVEQLTMDGQHVAYYDCIKSVHRLTGGRFHSRNIKRACLGLHQKTAYGYQWRYADKSFASQPSEVVPNQFNYTKRNTIIEQLTLDGQHVAYYKNATEAAKVLGCPISCIYQATKNIRSTSHGYRWRYADVSRDEVQFTTNTSPIQHKPKDTTIEQLTMDGQHVAYFPSMNQAAKAVSCARQNINRAVNKSRAAKGYRWRYVNNPGKEDTTHT